MYRCTRGVENAIWRTLGLCGRVQTTSRHNAWVTATKGGIWDGMREAAMISDKQTRSTFGFTICTQSGTSDAWFRAE